MSLRVLIVDDEPLACERLRHLLDGEPTAQLIGTCTGGREALTAIQRDAPDLVFLDVHMPEMDGFAIVKALPRGALPLVVIVTAHDIYAVQAFEAQAVDYLLKPFDRERLRQTLRRAQERVQALRALQIEARLADLRDRFVHESAPSHRIPVKENGRILFVKVDEIDWVGAADNYVELHAGRSAHLHLSTLTAFESHLPPGQFVRVSRSTLINVSRMKEIQFHRNGDGTVVLFNGTRLALSRTHRTRLAAVLGHK
jgi:two-component system LytT family response regulator